MESRYQMCLRYIQFTDESKIGEGSSGIIYKIALGEEEYALKRIYPRKRNAFLHEVSFFKKYQHPNIVKYFNHSETELLILLELCTKGDLFRHIISGQYDARQARSWLLDVAAALSYLHSNDVVHCDIKSDNVLIDHNNNAKLSDFDGCWIPPDDENKKNSVVPRVTSTTEYMAPEFYGTLNANNMMPSIDIYAFGLMMWEVMNKKGSWLDGAEPERPKPQQLLDTPMCEELYPVMARCWHINPNQRPPAADIIRRLQPYQPFDASIAEIDNEVTPHHSALRYTG